MSYHDERGCAADTPPARNESVPTGQLTCEVRVLSVSEEEK